MSVHAERREGCARGVPGHPHSFHLATDASEDGVAKLIGLAERYGVNH